LVKELEKLYQKLETQEKREHQYHAVN